MAQRSPVYQRPGTTVEGCSKVMMGKRGIKWKAFVSLTHGQPSNDPWKREGVNAVAETEVFAILSWSKFVALWFIFKGRHYTHWVEQKVSLGLNLSCGIRVTGFGANQPVIWGGWGGGCVWTAHPILPTFQWPFSRMESWSPVRAQTLL